MRKLFITVTILLVVGTVAAAKMKAQVGYDRDVDFEKCIVNKAEVTWDGEFEGSDTATVCYGDEEIKELPETGSNEVAALVGAGLIIVGILVRKRTSLA